jgi:hypothetical protein
MKKDTLAKHFTAADMRSKDLNEVAGAIGYDLK